MPNGGKMKKRHLYYLVGTSLLCVLCGSIFLYYNVVGRNIEGAVPSTDQLPIVGSLMNGFPCRGEVQYTYRKYHRGEAIIFTGKGNFDDIEKYCTNNRWYISEAKDRGSIQIVPSEFRVSPDSYPMSFKEGDLVVEQPKVENRIVLILNCIKSENSFTGFSYNNY
jgi:hypothetical protein